MPATRRVKLTVAYDGAGFRGFARNPGVRTVLEELTGAVATVVRRPVELTGAGRTDAGVHAWGQVVSGDLPADTDLADLSRRFNKLCAPAIAVRDGALGRRRLRRPLLGHVAALPLRRVERPDAEPAARRPSVVRAPAARRVGDAGGVRPADRRARLHVVLPGAQGRSRAARAVDGPAGAVGALERAGRPRSPALRDPGQRLLPPDGPLDRRHARRRRPRQGVTRRRPRASSSPATGKPPARSPRRTGWSCGRSATPDPRSVLRNRPDRAGFEGQNGGGRTIEAP